MTEREPTLSSAKREAFLARSADEIRMRGQCIVGDAIEIGRLLTDCRAQLGHGEWLPWLEREFAWSDRQAERFLSVFRLAGKFDNLSDLTIDLSALYLLGAKSTPVIVCEEMVARAREGEHITRRLVAEKRAEWQPASIRSVSLGTDPPRMRYEPQGSQAPLYSSILTGPELILAQCTNLAKDLHSITSRLRRRTDFGPSSIVVKQLELAEQRLQAGITQLELHTKAGKPH